MNRINYITNLPVNEYSGGWSGMNYNIHRQLLKNFELKLIENINPPYYWTDRVTSKLKRMFGLKGNFPAFTSQRLDTIKLQVENHLDRSASLNFFHGVTPWLHVDNAVPYALYLDACFATYIRTYHKQSSFSTKQLTSLFEKEARFLENAAAVFFSSEWALNDTKKSYFLKGDNFRVAGLGGGFLSAGNTSVEQTPYFLFVGLDFLGKGGDKVMNAFVKIQKEFPKYKLKIAGQSPPDQFLTYPNVEYLGMIDKSMPGALDKMIRLFTNAFCFLLPTSKDITPLVLVEAGSVGCPVIATDSFGIPEIVKHGETGILIKPDESLEKHLTAAMRQLCENHILRDEMSVKAREYITKNFSWNITGERISNVLSKS